jgi:hypothetical protein
MLVRRSELGRGRAVKLKDGGDDDEEIKDNDREDEISQRESEQIEEKGPMSSEKSV